MLKPAKWVNPTITPWEKRTLNANPFEPPNKTDTTPDDPVRDAKERLSRPATALIIMSSIQSVLVAIPLVSAVFVWFQSGLVAADIVPLTVGSLQFSGLLMIAIGAAKMGFLESYTLGRLAGFLACVPFITPFIIIGIPFGIWALRLLSDPMIESAFRSVADAKTAA